MSLYEVVWKQGVGDGLAVEVDEWVWHDEQGTSVTYSVSVEADGEGWKEPAQFVQWLMFDSTLLERFIETFSEKFESKGAAIRGAERVHKVLKRAGIAKIKAGFSRRDTAPTSAGRVVRRAYLDTSK